MRCPECGKEIGDPNFIRFCPYCAVEITDEIAAAYTDCDSAPLGAVYSDDTKYDDTDIYKLTVHKGIRAGGEVYTLKNNETGQKIENIVKLSALSIMFPPLAIVSLVKMVRLKKTGGEEVRTEAAKWFFRFAGVFMTFGLFELAAIIVPLVLFFVFR